MAERPEDLNLPNAVITRIIKDALPDGVAVSKEAKSAMSKAASVFVLYATSTANALAQINKKKTVSAQDVLTALQDIEFGNFIPPLQESLETYKKSVQNKKDAKKAKKAGEEDKNTSVADDIVTNDSIGVTS